MAPEMDDMTIPKTNRVDIWALGCILYRMVAGRPLFNTRFELYKYVMTASPPPPINNVGLSVPCVDFLSEVLYPKPEDRPSAEDCLNKAWIINKAPGPEYSIGSDLHKRLKKIELTAPYLELLDDAAVNPAVGVHCAPVREFPAWKLNYDIGHGAFGTVFLEKGQPPGQRVRTDPVAPNSTQSRYLGVDNVAGGFPFFSGGAIFGGRCPRLLGVART